MEPADPEKRHALRWNWILLIPAVLGAAFCVTFGPFLYTRGLARRLEAQGVQLTYARHSKTWYNQLIRTVPGFETYGENLSYAHISCERRPARADSQQIAEDLRSLHLGVYLDLTGSTNIAQDLKLFDSNRIVGVTARDCVISAGDLKLLLPQRELTDLELTNCELDVAAFQELSRLKSLMTLVLNGTSITDEGLTHLRHLKNLATLSLSNTQTSDAAKEDLLKVLPNLELSDD